MKITVTAQVLSGNLGDGWKNQNEAAVGFADFLEGRIRERCLEQYPTTEIEVEIDVQHNTSGCARELSVSVDPWNDESGYEIENNLRDQLLDTEQDAWENFCGDAGSEYFSKEA